MRLARLIFISMLVACCASAADLANPSFETHNEQGFVGWKGTGAKAVARDWRLLKLTVATKGFRRAALVVRSPAGGGSLWVGAASAGGLVDGDFSHQKVGGRPMPPWGSDGDAMVRGDFGLKGKPSIRLVTAGERRSELRQVFECRPGVLARLSLWYRAESQTGPSTVLVEGLSREGAPLETLASIEMAGPGELKPGGVWCAQVGKGLSTTFDAAAGTSLATMFEVRGSSKPGGELVVTVRPEGDGGKAETFTRSFTPGARWQRESLVFVCRKGGRYGLSFSTRGECVAEIDEVRVCSPASVPAPRSIRVARASESFPVKTTPVVVVSGDSARSVLPGLAGVLGRNKGGAPAAVESRSAEAKKRPRVVILSVKDPGHKALADELGVEMPSDAAGYTLKVTADQVVMAGESAEGLAHCARSLMWLVTASPEPVIVGVDISDSPAGAVRGVAMTVPAGGVPAAEAAGLARLGFNTVFIDSPESYPPAAKAPEGLRSSVVRCGEAGLRPVVVFRSLGRASEIAAAHPAASAAVWVHDERRACAGEAPMTFGRANVISSGATRPEIWSALGVRFTPGGDYVLVPGATAYPFSPAAARWTVKRRAGGRMSPGEELVFRYDSALVTGGRAAPLCPSEPAAERAVDAGIDRIVSGLAGLKGWGVHLGGRDSHKCRCSRCVRSGRTAERLYASRIERSARRVLAAASDATVFISGEPFDPFRGGSAPLAGALRFIPRDLRGSVVVVVSGSTDRSRSARYFGDAGFRTVELRSLEDALSPGGDPGRGGGSSGTVFELGCGDCSLEYAAQAAWGRGGRGR